MEAKYDRILTTHTGSLAAHQHYWRRRSARWRGSELAAGGSRERGTERGRRRGLPSGKSDSTSSTTARWAKRGFFGYVWQRLSGFLI